MSLTDGYVGDINCVKGDLKNIPYSYKDILTGEAHGLTNDDVNKSNDLESIKGKQQNNKVD